MRCQECDNSGKGTVIPWILDRTFTCLRLSRRDDVWNTQLSKLNLTFKMLWFNNVLH